MKRLGACAVGTSLLLVSAAAGADPNDAPEANKTDWSTPRVNVRSDTYFQLYRRALLPGAYGAIVETESEVPVYEYASLTADGIATPWKSGSLHVELDAWGAASMVGDSGDNRRVDGDVRNASVTWLDGGGFVRAGRQNVAGGAARFARFDGLMAGGTLPFGLGADAYAGLTVLPRWNARPGYHQLGAAADSLLKDPTALPDPERGQNWLAGGRIYYHGSHVDGGMSFHEQHETTRVSLGGPSTSALARRNLGADARFDLTELATVGGYGIMDLDSTHIADARAYADVTPIRQLSLDAEVLHAEPSLFLSRQSVLSVFSTTKYDEVGGTVSGKPIEQITLFGSGFGEAYSTGDRGSRFELGTKITPDRFARTLVRVSAGRVEAVGNGYKTVRVSLHQRIVSQLAGTAEGYWYFYDNDIRGLSSSSVYAGTLEWAFLPELRLLWGGSLVSSPYAAADAQTLVRLAYGHREVLR